MATIQLTFGTVLETVNTAAGSVTKTVRIADRWLDAAVASTEHHVTEIEARYKKLAETREDRATISAAIYMADQMREVEEFCKDPTNRGHYETALKMLAPKRLSVA